MTEDEHPPAPPEPPGDQAPPPPGEPAAAPVSEPEWSEPELVPFWGYGDLFLFVGLAVPALLLGIGVVQGTLWLFNIHFAARAAEPLAAQFVGYIFIFGILMLILRLQYKRPFWRSLGWIGFNTPVLWVILSGLASALTVAMIGALLGAPNTPNAVTDLMSDRASLLILTVFGVTLGPVCEELAFRGFLQPLLVRSLGAALGIILAAIPFGLLHYQEYGNSWRHAVIVAAAGAAFGCMRHFTGSTRAAAIMHSAYNALFFAAVLAQRGDALK